MEFLTVDSVETARQKLLSHIKSGWPKKENVTLDNALGRILAEDIYSPEDIPPFRRSTVDGYAVFSADTAAAGESIPALLTVKARVEMGEAATFEIGRGECAEVPTGGMVPDGADAVVMVEYCEPFGGEVAVHCSAAYGENIVQIGEDAKKGTLLAKRGRCLLPQDIGALAAVGVTDVSVFAAPRMTVISTGDELVSAEKKPAIGQVRDINTRSLTALAQKTGYEVVAAYVAPDDEKALEAIICPAMQKSDIVAVSGGSSQGAKDMTKAALDRVSSPGVFTHGLALKPGKPTILGFDDRSGTILAGLPGHPVSAMVVFELIFGWLLRELTGMGEARHIPARISTNVAASPGKLTCHPAKLHWTGLEYVAEPIFKKSGLITALTVADGYFAIECGTEGLRAGESVLVHLF